MRALLNTCALLILLCAASAAHAADVPHAAINSTYFWIVTFLLGLGTFLERLSFLQLFSNVKLSGRVYRMLSYIPPAVLSALLAPSLLFGKAEGYTFDGYRIAAACVAAIVAWKTRNVVWTILSGMAVLWGLLSM